jgi:hypothetical protein
VPSSISSSSSRAPAGPWLLTWALALAMAAGMVYKLEMHVRAKGYKASVRDNPTLWAYHRGRVSDSSARTVALLGASRMQLGFSTRQFRQEFPGYKLAMLAIDGTAPVGSLRDLAADPDFRGIAIVSMTAPAFREKQWNHQDEYINYYHDGVPPGLYLNRFLETLVEQRLVLRSAGGMRALSMLITHHRWPRAIYLTTWADRSRSAHYRLVNIKARRKHRIERLRAQSAKDTRPDPEAWLDQAVKVEPFVEAIRARGGHVVFVRFPTSDEHLEHTERIYPKAEFWDRFAARTRATTVHFLDYPQLSGFDCPDTSHLDMRDAPAFTSALAEILVQKGVLERPPAQNMGANR